MTLPCCLNYDERGANVVRKSVCFLHGARSQWQEQDATDDAPILEQALQFLQEAGVITGAEAATVSGEAAAAAEAAHAAARAVAAPNGGHSDGSVPPSRADTQSPAMASDGGLAVPTTSSSSRIRLQVNETDVDRLGFQGEKRKYVIDEIATFREQAFKTERVDEEKELALRREVMRERERERERHRDSDSEQRERARERARCVQRSILTR